MLFSSVQQNRNKVGGLYRITLVLYIFYFFVAIIMLRFFYLQIIKGSSFKQKSLGNTEREFVLSPLRGLIFDTRGKVIAKNKNAFSLSFIGGYVPKKKELRDFLFKEIARETGLNVLFLEKKYRENRKNYQFVLIKESLSMRELIYLNEFKNYYPFLNIVEYSGRDYPYGESLSHVLGYIGAISKGEFQQLKQTGYKQDNILGKAGIEKQYDLLLRGQEGKTVKVIDSLGRTVQNLPEKNVVPIPGKNLVLSIDADLQDIAYYGLKGRKGAVIVSKVSTGEILALVSSPGYNPNNFINTNDKEGVFSKLLQDEGKPFFNRAIQGQYSPGSIFKIVIALAALEDNQLDPHKVEDTHLGYFKLGNQIFKDHGVKKSADLATALEKSNNVYFYKLAHTLGYSSILEYAILLGLRDKTNIDIPSEIMNFTPTMEWKEKRLKEVWVEGDTINISIGQGFLLYTPLGIHNIISTVAAGKLIRPRLAWEVKSPYTGITEEKFAPAFNNHFEAKIENLQAIREGLMRAVNVGTARYHQYLSKVKIAGKTGTAQNSTGKDHALFSSYGPIDAPMGEQYAVTVVAESSGWGSGVVPIGSVIYNYLEGVQTKEQAIRTLGNILPSLKNVKEEEE